MLDLLSKRESCIAFFGLGDFHVTRVARRPQAMTNAPMPTLSEHERQLRTNCTYSNEASRWTPRSRILQRSGNVCWHTAKKQLGAAAT
jgi:hypothetical protein